MNTFFCQFMFPSLRYQMASPRRASQARISRLPSRSTSANPRLVKSWPWFACGPTRERKNFKGEASNVAGGSSTGSAAGCDVAAMMKKIKTGRPMAISSNRPGEIRWVGELVMLLDPMVHSESVRRRLRSLSISLVVAMVQFATRLHRFEISAQFHWFD